MHMMLMLGILTVIYFITLFIMCLYRTKINFKICNTAFIIVDLVAFFAWNYAAYLYGWLESGWMTLGNISPLMFTVILLIPFMKENIQTYAYSTISFLSVGMFFAMLITPEHAYLFNFDQEATFYLTSEAICHLICSLYGVFLILCGKVKADFKHWLQSLIFLYTFIGLGVVLNFIFHKDYFGMDPYGNYRIYMIDIFGSFYATLFAYFAGVMVVLTVGMQVAKLVEHATVDKDAIHESEKDKIEGEKLPNVGEHKTANAENTDPINENEATNISK